MASLQSPSSAAPSRRINNRRGILLMTLALFLYSAIDATAKGLTQELHPLQIIWFRLVGMLAVALGGVAYYGPRLFKTQHRALQILRGFLAVGSTLLFIITLKFVPLAEATAATFVMPFMVTILGALLLKETVGIRRWSAVVIGFLGAMIIMRPGLGVVHPSILLVVVAAAMFASRQVVGRILSRTDSTATTLLYTSLTATVAVSIFLPWVWITPANSTLWFKAALLLGLSGIAEWLMIKAFEDAEATALAPFHYTLILWSTFYGVVLFGEFPDGWTWIGTGIIVAAGLYTVQRERKAAAAGA